MSSARWKPNEADFGIFGNYGDSDYDNAREEGFSGTGDKARYNSLKGNLNTSIAAMGNQMEALNIFTQDEIGRAENTYGRAENARDRAEGAFNRAGEKKAMGIARGAMQMSNAGTTASLSSAQTQLAGKAAAQKASQGATQLAAASGIESMGQVQTQHEEALKSAYSQSAIANTQAGMQQRTSQFGAMETVFGAQQAYADAGDRRGVATDAFAQAGDTREAQIGQATLNQANALAGMARDISSMTTAFTQATEKTFSSSQLDALMDDLEG